MKKRLSALLLLTFGATTLLAQNPQFDPKDIVNYQLLKDDVENYKFASAGIAFAQIDLAVTNLSAYGLAFYAQGEVNPNLFLMADYSFMLAERLAHPTDFTEIEPGFRSVNVDSRSNRLRLEGTYYFSSETKKEDVYVSVKTTSEFAGRGDGSRVQVMHVVKVNADVNTRLGFRLGLDRGVAAYNMSSADRLSAIRPDGVTTSFDVAGGMKGSSYMDYSVLRLGFARTKLANVHINTEKYGYRHHSFMRYFYADILLALRQEIEDVYATRTDLIEINEFTGETTTPFYERMNLQDANEFRNLGIAVGYRAPSISGGSEQVFELGYYPGIQGVNGLYFQFGWRFGFGTSQKMKNVPPYSK